MTTFYVFRMKSCNDDVARGRKNSREATEGMRCVEIVAYLFTGKTALGHSPAKNQCLLYYSHLFKKKNKAPLFLMTTQYANTQSIFCQIGFTEHVILSSLRACHLCYWDLHFDHHQTYLKKEIDLSLATAQWIFYFSSGRDNDHKDFSPASPLVWKVLTLRTRDNLSGFPYYQMSL